MAFIPFTADDQPTIAAFNQKFQSILENPYLWDGPKKLGSLVAGDLIKLNENGHPVKFIKLDNDHYGTGSGVTLIRKDAFSEIAWNASDNSAYKNRYFGCTIDSFCDGIWPLKLDPEVRECLVPVPIVVAEGNGVATLHTIYRKGFAISCTEAGVAGWQTEGRLFSYFSDNKKRIAYLEDTTSGVNWGLRSQDSGIFNACYINAVGALAYNGVYSSFFAPRPAFNLNPNMVITSTPDADGCYNLLAEEDAQ